MTSKDYIKQGQYVDPSWSFFAVGLLSVVVWVILFTLCCYDCMNVHSIASGCIYGQTLASHFLVVLLVLSVWGSYILWAIIFGFIK